jgi:hypothetical protein
LLSAIVILELASGCAALTGAALPTPLPAEYLPTAVAQTVQAGDVHPAETAAPPAAASAEPSAQPPAATASPGAPTQTPLASAGIAASPSPPVSPTPRPPPGIPYAAIQIHSPGPASKVASPFLLRASVPPGPNGIVRIELLGEDGRLLMREVRAYTGARGAPVTLGEEVSFGISAVAEAGRLQISTEDENGQLASLASVDLLLLSIGESDLNPPGDQLERIAIEAPQANALIQGGTVRVSGLARPLSDQPLMVELIATDGKILGSRQVAVDSLAGGGHGRFAVDVSYSTGAPTRVRLLVWEPGAHIPGIAYLSSLEVMLSP